MSAIFGRLFKWLVYTAAAGVMVLALLVGIARLFLPLVPDYQDDIRRWAGEATGFDVQFERISASWPFAGPEIQFFDVTISSSDDGQPILVADALTVRVSLLRLLRDQQITVGQVGVSGTRIEIQRDADGIFYLQGRPFDQLLTIEREPDQPLQLPDLTVELTDIRIVFRDSIRGEDFLEFNIEQLEIEFAPTGLALDGDIELPRDLGEHVTVSADVPVGLLLGIAAADSADDKIDDSEWNVYVAASELDVAKILELGLDMVTPLASAQGDVVVWASFAGAEPRSVTVELDLNDISLRRSDDAVDVYGELRGQVEWMSDDTGWLLGGTDIRVTRAAGTSPSSQFSVAFKPDSETGVRRLLAKARFVRLHDWYPIMRALATEDIRDALLPDDLRGDLRDLDLELRLVDDQPPEFDVELSFDDVAVLGWRPGEALSGFSGSIVADQAGGRLQIDSRGAIIDLPLIFMRPIAVESIEGFMVWRVSRDGVRILSDNVEVRTSIARASAGFELSLPGNGDSPYLDLTAYAEFSDVRGALDYLPMRKFPPKVAGWLERAIIGGRVTGAEIEMRGPLRDYPFDHDEGILRIEAEVVDGVLDAMPGWPRIENIDGELVFDGRGLYSRRNRGMFGSAPFVNADVQILNLREGILEVGARQSVGFEEGLGLLRASPIAAAVGPTIERIEGSGQFDIDLLLTIPIKRPKEFELTIDLSTNDTEVTLSRLGFGLTGLAGSVRVENTKFYADNLTAQLLDEPVSITLRPSGDPDERYSQFATVSGVTAVQSWMEALNLPLAENFSGTVNWKAMALFPRRRADGERDPLHLLVRSDMRGVGSALPAPLSKSPDTTSALELDVVFLSDEVIEVNGRLARELTWALRLEAEERPEGASEGAPEGAPQGARWAIERGTVHSGTAAALLPLEPGLELSGHLGFLRFDEWLALGEGDADSNWSELYTGASVQVDRLSFLGQYFPDVQIDARRGSIDWELEFASPNLAGTARVPLDPDDRRPMVIDMERLWMLESDSVDQGESDPRAVQPATIHVDDFVLGDMHFGSLDAVLEATPSGLVIDPISLQSETFSIDGDAAWLVHPNDDTLQQSKMRLSLEGTDIRALLTSLGYDPVIKGERVQATADLKWLGPPAADFLTRADGTFGLQMEKGAVLSLEPGGGRLLGILSVTALPRRLALDFSDVVDEGLSFDRLKGDFTVDDGNFYTCNLGLEGSVADMGIVGRTGIEFEDYDQIAVVRPHVSNLLAIGGAVVAGPVVGAAMLLFSQIFRDPLSQLGESYYRVTGGWDDPIVEQIQRSELDATPLKNCEEYLGQAVTESLKE